jgi:hypothetical protein
MREPDEDDVPMSREEILEKYGWQPGEREQREREQTERRERMQAERRQAEARKAELEWEATLRQRAELLCVSPGQKSYAQKVNEAQMTKEWKAYIAREIEAWGMSLASVTKEKREEALAPLRAEIAELRQQVTDLQNDLDEQRRRLRAHADEQELHERLQRLEQAQPHSRVPVKAIG